MIDLREKNRFMSIRISGSRIVVRGESSGNGSEGVRPWGCCGLAAPGAGVIEQSLWWGLGQNPSKFPKFVKLFIDFH